MNQSKTWKSLYRTGTIAALLAGLLFRRNIGAEVSLFTGILAMLLSVMLMIWAGWFVQRRHGGWVQMALSILLLLFGGGFFPPIIAFAGGLAGRQINRPLAGQPSWLTRLAARLWPWSLVIFVVWTLGQFPVGHFFNDFLKSIMYVSLLVILTSLPLAVYPSYAHNAAQ